MSQLSLVALTGFGYDAASGEYVCNKQVGKSVVARYLTQRHGFKELLFAGPLKEMICQAYRLPPPAYYEEDGKRKEAADPRLGGRSWRYVLQRFGTEVIRVGLNKHLPRLRGCEAMWVNKLIQQIQFDRLPALAQLTARLFDLNHHECFSGQPVARWGGYTFAELQRGLEQGMAENEMPTLPTAPNCLHVVSDMRFHNEYQALTEKLQATVVQIRRPVHVTQAREGQRHASDVYDVRMSPHIVLNNRTTLEELTREVEAFLRR